MGLGAPVLASPMLRHNAEKPPAAPRPKGTTDKSHSHAVAPNRWYDWPSQFLNVSQCHKIEGTMTYWYFNQKVFPPLVSRILLAIEFALTLG